MDDQNTERLLELCELAAKEQDANKLIKMIYEINRLLDANSNVYLSRPVRRPLSNEPIVVGQHNGRREQFTAFKKRSGRVSAATGGANRAGNGSL
jgi:hypothetical protein